MTAPFTVLFGPWQPDLSNNGIPAPFDSGGGTSVPVVDVLNVIYANGNYYNAPSPAPIAPAASGEVFNAFSWYDSNTQQQLIFAGEGQNVEVLIDGTWTAVPFFSSQQVAIQGFALKLVLSAISQGQTLKVASKLGQVTVSATSTASVAISPPGATFQNPRAPGPHTFALTAVVTGGNTPTGYAWHNTGSGTLAASTTTVNTNSLDLGQSLTAGISVTVSFSGGEPSVTSPVYAFMNTS